MSRAQDPKIAPAADVPKTPGPPVAEAAGAADGSGQ